jgi:hypothetical protein
MPAALRRQAKRFFFKIRSGHSSDKALNKSGNAAEDKKNFGAFVQTLLEKMHGF